MKRGALIDWLTAPALLIGFFLVWEAYVVGFGVSRFILPPPSRVWTAFVALLETPSTYKHMWITVQETLGGFAIAILVGIGLGAAIGKLAWLERALNPFIVATQVVPKIALVPLFILWFGIDDAPKLWLVGLLVFYPVFIAVFAGIRNVDRRLINMARVVGASEGRISREVIWNSLLPFFFSALKIALPRAVSAAIIGEFLVGNEGLGYMIEYSRQNFDTIGVFAGVVVATALVLLINAVLVRVDRRVNSWRPTERDMEL